MAITATSIKLPSTLKAELEELARRSGETSQRAYWRPVSRKTPA
jgi:predicted transcriptional regulator